MSSERAPSHLRDVSRPQQSLPLEAREPIREESPAAFVAPEAQICPKCFGAGIEVVAGKGARTCVCRQRKRRTNMFAAARVPPRYETCTLDTYTPVAGSSFDSQTRARNLAYNLIYKYPGIEQGLLYMGAVGVGKTHLAVGIIQGMVKVKGIQCLFYQFGALLKEIQNSYNPIVQSSELSILAPVLNVPVLVLDELGASKPTDWVRDTMLHVINSRYNEKKLTVFTTNYLDTRRHQRDETLEDRIGVRLRSRLYEMCRTVAVEGEDYRRRFDR